MGKGYLKVQTVTANGGVIVGDVSITVMGQDGQVLYEVQTDNMGMAAPMALDAPDKRYTEEPESPVKPFASYKLIARAPGFMTAIYEGVMIFDTSTSILIIEMDPVVLGQENGNEIREIEGHKLYETTEPQQVQTGAPEIGFQPFVLPEVSIPNFIRVHLGREENTSAQTVSVPFINYIKNVTSHEIFDTWPEEAIIANVYCIVSLTLNRVYTEFYRKRGRNFDITSETYYDQKFVYNGTIGARISAIVDRIFNYYLAIVGHKEPFLSLYNDGIRVNIPGRLSQWGSFYDARDQGMNAWQIIRKYYSQNLELRISDNFGGVLESYPGYTLTQGSRGNAVRTMQLYLNRVLGRYTNVIINPVDGIYGPQTTASVRMFQQLYNLPVTGNIDRRTWYEISRIYAIERGLWEMYSEGQRIGIGQVPPTQTTRMGDQGALVVELQFLLDFIAMYHSEIPFVAQTSRFDSLTDEGVRAFQRLFGITPDGVVGATTWRKLYDVYWGIMQNTVPPQPPPPNPNPPENIPPFPGTSLRVGSTGASVRLVQEAINKLAQITPGMWQIAVDGVFGNGTRDAVMAFQRIFGLVVDGIVGPVTWNRLMTEANMTVSTPPIPGIPPFPGTNLGVGSSGANVRLIQEALNTLAPYYPGRLWILTVDGAYGNMTRDAIYAFQSIFGLPLTGIVNEATWNRLMQEAASVSGGGGGGGGTQIPPFPGNLSMGASGANVRLVQEAINTLAPSYPGRLWILTVDGNFGPMTRDAIFTFQSLFGLPITGIINESTWNRLMQEAAGVRMSAMAEAGMDSMMAAPARYETPNAGSMRGDMVSMPMPAGCVPQNDMVPMRDIMPKEGVMPREYHMQRDDMVPQEHHMQKDGMKPRDYDMPRDDMMPGDYHMQRDDVVPQEHHMQRDGMRPRDYDMPRDDMMPGDYDVPRDNMIPREHHIPRDGMKPRDYDVPRDDMMPREYDVPRDNMIPQEHHIQRDGMKPRDYDMPKTEMKQSVEVMSGSVMPQPYESLPYGTGVSGMEPMGMRFSERGPDRRGYGYGYRERNYCDVRGHHDGRCSCGRVRKECRCRRHW